MILVWMIVILMVGGLLAWFLEKVNASLPRTISLIAVSITFFMALWLWLGSMGTEALAEQGNWLINFQAPWIPQLGISFHLAMDGLSLLMILLTTFLGILAVLTGWDEIKEQAGFYHFNLLFILAGILGVFVAMDLFLFYFFWEVMLIPMYFLIGIWGHENRVYAAYKFFIFTQASGLLMLISIVAMYFIHGQQTGDYSFDYFALLNTMVSDSLAIWLMLGFLAAFAVKLPVVPVHNWLPDAHTEAPTAGSLILAGLLLKTGAYGLLRFVLPLFPEASITFAPYGMALGVIGILYGAKLAFSQTDLKRLVAYTSVSHMGFVMLGVFAFNEIALQGVVMQIITHGVSTGALFIMVGAIQERIHTRDINSMGGLWEKVPRMGVIGLVFVMASLGLPGLGNFIAEFMTLVGAYKASIGMTVLASLGLIFASVYSLRIMQKVFYGPQQKEWNMPDFNFREMVVMGSLVAVILWLGFYPMPVLHTSEATMKDVKSKVWHVVEQQSSASDTEIEPMGMNGKDIGHGIFYRKQQEYRSKNHSLPPFNSL